MYSGEITELNMWSEILDQSKIALLASCKSFEKGNVVAWLQNNFTIHAVAVRAIVEVLA